MPLTIAVLGDSITAGVALLNKNGHPVQENWPELLGHLLNTQVYSFGVGGSNTFDGLQRLNQALAVNSDIILLEFGMNDSIIENAQEQCQVPLEQFRENLLSMCKRCSDAGAFPILMTPNTVIEEYYYQRHPVAWYQFAGGARGQIARYRSAIIEVAAQFGCPCIDIWQTFLQYEDRLGQLLRSPDNGGMEDGVHPYGQGIHLYATTVAEVVKTLEIQKNC